MNSRPSHHKDVEPTLQAVAATPGWTLVYPSGHWGRMRCDGPSEPQGPLDHCRMTIGGTHPNPPALARKIRTKVRNCPHGHATTIR